MAVYRDIFAGATLRSLARVPRVSNTLWPMALFTLLLLAVTPLAQAQFTAVPNTGFPMVMESSVAWGDYNNDGLLDLIVIGSTDTAGSPRMDTTKFVAKLFRNNGDGTFTAVNNTGLMPMSVGTAVWGDFDNDGYLDLALGGVDTTSVGTTRLYHNNNGNGTFTEVTGTAFHSSSYGNLAWGDYNNDGYLDLLLCAFDDVAPVTKLYRNNKNGTFTEVTTAGLMGANGHSKVVFGDYDNDGYPDVLVCGRTNHSSWTDPQSKTKLFHNNKGDGTFTEDTSAHFVGVTRAAIAMADFNNDGYLDVFVSGLSGPALGVSPLPDTTVVYLNNHGDGTFTAAPQSAGLSGTNQSYMSVGDYDADGKLDVLLGGYGSNDGFYRGLGNGTFANLALGTREVAIGGVAWGDYNGDGYLDALVTGTLVAVARDTTILYRNTGPGTSNVTPYTPNVKPNAPTNLAAKVDSVVRLSWKPATDAKTPSAGLTYNLRIGTTPGGSTIVSPLADSTGRRRVAAIGPQGLDTAWTIKGLANGTYYWSVQAIDNSFAGSAFATEGTFTVGKKDTSSGAVTPKTIAFDSVVVMAAKRDSIKVRNTGSLALNVIATSVTDTSFKVSPDSAQIAAGDSAKFYVTFTPNSLSSVTGKIAFSSTPAAIKDTVTVSGKGYYLRLSQVRGLAAGSVVSFTGTVTRSMGAYTYMQDTSGGIVIRQATGAFKDTVAKAGIRFGTKLTISGKTKVFNNLLEIDGTDLMRWQITGRDTTVKPIVLTLAQIKTGGEQYESRLIQVNSLTVVGTTDSLFKAATTYNVVDKSDTTKAVSLRIGAATDTQIDSTRIPKAAFLFTGVLGQFSSSNPTAGYQLTPIQTGDISPAVSVDEITNLDAVPRTFALLQNYPNPFNPSTTIEFTIPREAHVVLEVYNVIGQRVATLVDEVKGVGSYRVRFDASKLASGMYIYRLATPETSFLKKMLLLK